MMKLYMHPVSTASRPVRLLGVSVHNLEDPSAPFEPEEPLLPF